MQALAADPQSAELYANRAQTRLKLENYLEAVEDASKALDLNPRLSKAHLRKGCAVSRADLLSCRAATSVAAYLEPAILLLCCLRSCKMFQKVTEAK